MRAVLRILAVILTLFASDIAIADEQIVLVAGGGERTDTSGAKEAKLIAPFGIDFDTSGTGFLVELTGQRVLQLDRDGKLSTIAGTGEKGEAGDNGLGLKAQFNGMHSLAVAPDGTLMLADTWNNRVRKLDPSTGIVTNLAGTGNKGFSGDGGPCGKAEFGGIYCLAFDSTGKRLYLADLDNRRVRMLDLTRDTVTTVAGNGQKGSPKDGAVAIESPLVDPRAVAVDSKDNVYILERSGHALRVVDSKGKIRTVVGTGKPGASGDDGDARQATLNGPKHLCVDADDNIIIADTENHIIRKYLPKGNKVVRLAGTGKKGTGGIDGSPLKADLNQPHGVYLHRSGELYIVDSSNDRVLKIVSRK